MCATEAAGRGEGDEAGGTGGPWEILARAEGTWEGPEVLAPAPWAPDGMEATGRTTGRRVLGGRGLSSDYVQEVEGAPGLRAHTLIRWVEAEDGGRFAMSFVSEPGGRMELRGRADGPDTLVFEGDGPAGPMRQTFVYGDGRMEVRSESRFSPGGAEEAAEEAEWAETFRASYRRVPGGEGEADAPAPGTIGWHDLTVEDAPAVRDFYAAVCGWEPSPVEMDGYADYDMSPPGRDPVAGVCHARGVNAELPSVWLAYVVVDDVGTALDAVRAHGGEVVTGPRSSGDAETAVVRDPAGAVLALWSPRDAGGARPS